MPYLETLIGAAAALCTTVSYIPQLRKCWETGETGDLSLKMLLLLASGLGVVAGVRLHARRCRDHHCQRHQSCAAWRDSLSSRFAGRKSHHMKPRRPPTASCLRAVLEPAFFDRPADQVARDLLGKALLRRIGRNQRTFVIAETEAYLGSHDLACHSARGRTARTEVMFGPPGTLYIYLVYGLHWMLNVVTAPPGSAVLLRSAGGANGPGRLGAALAITGTLNGKAAQPLTGLWFEDRSVAGRVIATPRIGVDYAGQFWSRRKLRFVLGPRISRRNPHPPATLMA